MRGLRTVGQSRFDIRFELIADRECGGFLISHQHLVELLSLVCEDIDRAATPQSRGPEEGLFNVIAGIEILAFRQPFLLMLAEHFRQLSIAAAFAD